LTTRPDRPRRHRPCARSTPRSVPRDRRRRPPWSTRSANRPRSEGDLHESTIQSAGDCSALGSLLLESVLLPLSPFSSAEEQVVSYVTPRAPARAAALAENPAGSLRPEPAVGAAAEAGLLERPRDVRARASARQGHRPPPRPVTSAKALAGQVMWCRLTVARFPGLREHQADARTPGRARSTATGAPPRGRGQRRAPRESAGPGGPGERFVRFTSPSSTTRAATAGDPTGPQVRSNLKTTMSSSELTAGRLGPATTSWSLVAPSSQSSVPPLDPASIRFGPTRGRASSSESQQTKLASARARRLSSSAPPARRWRPPQQTRAPPESAKFFAAQHRIGRAGDGDDDHRTSARIGGLLSARARHLSASQKRGAGQLALRCWQVGATTRLEAGTPAGAECNATLRLPPANRSRSRRGLDGGRRSGPRYFAATALAAPGAKLARALSAVDHRDELGHRSC